MFLLELENCDSLDSGLHTDQLEHCHVHLVYLPLTLSIGSSKIHSNSEVNILFECIIILLVLGSISCPHLSSVFCNPSKNKHMRKEPQLRQVIETKENLQTWEGILRDCKCSLPLHVRIRLIVKCFVILLHLLCTINAPARIFVVK